MTRKDLVDEFILSSTDTFHFLRLPEQLSLCGLALITYQHLKKRLFCLTTWCTTSFQ